MTHGGLNSLQETIYHGVPVIGLPFMTDQHLNLKRAVDDGYAIKLEWKDVNEESLTNVLQQILHNSRFINCYTFLFIRQSNNSKNLIISYEKSADRLSKLFQDQLQSPLDRAVFWTEFVIRHNGTQHLTLGSRDLAPLQRQLIDVYLILFLIAFLPFFSLFLCIRKCCCGRKSKKNTQITKKNQ